MTAWIALFDASALAKRYSVEAGSDVVDEIFERLPEDRVVCSVIGVAEVVSILVRKKNDGRIDPSYFHQAMLNFRADFIESPHRLLPLDGAVILDSLSLIHRHSINATDAALLRSALNTQAEMAGESSFFFIASDRRLVRAARHEGFTVFDPENHTIDDLDKILNRS